MNRWFAYPTLCGLGGAAALSLAALPAGLGAIDPYGGAFIVTDDPVLRAQMPAPPGGALIGAVLLAGLAMPLVARRPRTALHHAG